MKDILNTDEEKAKLQLTTKGKVAAVAGTLVVTGIVATAVGEAVDHSLTVNNDNPNVVLDDNNSPQPSNDSLMQDIQRHRQQMDNSIQINSQYNGQH